MWVAGIGQGLLLRAFDEYGNLAYTFVETVSFLHQPYIIRAIGGAFFLTGTALMGFNTLMTILKARKEQSEIEAKIAAKLASA